MLEIITGFKDEDFFNNVNLHIHSNLSDGIYDFDDLVEQALKKNLKHISITDHNCVEGYRKTKHKDCPILIKGVEFDCIYRLTLLHVLGYGIDIENEKINSLCSNDKNDFVRILKSRNPKKVIEAIHDAGGIAVLAHPCCCNTFNLDKFVKKLVDMGLDGIETHYPYDRFRGIVKFHSRKIPPAIAKKYNLVQTGGTDEHGML